MQSIRPVRGSAGAERSRRVFRDARAQRQELQQHRREDPSGNRDISHRRKVFRVIRP